MTWLIIDTETTGIVQHDLRSDDPRQPHLVELGAIVFDPDVEKIRAQVSLIVRPQGWEIPEGAARVHGIDTNTAHKFGVPLETAVDLFASMAASAQTMLAFNLPFDRRVMRSAWLRCGRTRKAFDAVFDFIGEGPNVKGARCVMHRCTPIVNLPPTDRMLAAGFDKPKSPKLGEAYKFFFGEELQGAHGALADCRAALRIWREMDRRASSHDGAYMADPKDTEAARAESPA